MNNLLLSFDLAGAEWFVTGYLANEPRMIEIHEQGGDAHVKTASYLTGVPENIIKIERKLLEEETDTSKIEAVRRQHLPEIYETASFLPHIMTCRQAGKKSNHGLNYGMEYKRFALENLIPETEAQPMVRFYRTKAYPRLPKWYEEIQKELRDNHRELKNCFGRKVRLLDAWGPTLFMDAYAFKPQSTIADIVVQGMSAFYESEVPRHQLAIAWNTTHDELTIQYPISNLLDAAATAVDLGYHFLKPPIRYSGHEFFIEVECKVGFSWGKKAMRGVVLSRDVELVEKGLREILEQRKEAA